MATTVTCPHCGKAHEINLGQLLGSKKSKAKAEASRFNGDLGGRPVSKDPVRLRPYHPGHKDHHKWLEDRRALGKIK